MRRPLLVLALVVGALPACGGATGADGHPTDADGRPPPPARARHLLLITVDTLRADHLGFAGGRPGVSPYLDEFAAEGVVFDRCHAPMGLTLPSMGSLMTSRYPDETGLRRNSEKLPPDELTLAERLAEAGFRCRGRVASSVLQPNASNIEQGIDDYRVVEQEGWMTDMAIQMLKHDFGDDPERREFLWLHYMDPHQPFEAVEPYFSEFDAGYDGPYDASDETMKRIFRDKIVLDDADLDHIKATYDSQIRRIDLYVRWLMMALESSGHAEDTLVVFTADHGEELYDHNCYFHHGASLYGSVTHVPLVLRQPGTLPAGRRVDDLVELVDVKPTVLAHLGLPVGRDGTPAGRGPMRGHDLSPAFTAERPVGRQLAFAQLAGRVYAVRTPDWFYVANPSGFQPASIPKATYPIERRELYDLRSDPREQENVADRHPEIVEQLDRVLADWRGTLVEGDSVRQDLDAETLEMLEMLGYVEGDG